MSFDYRQCVHLAMKYLPENPVVVDVGCNINPIVEMDYAEWIENWNDDFTFIFLEMISDAKCIGIEPLHWQTYEERWKNDARVNLLKIGLSDKDDSEIIYVPGVSHVVSSFYRQDCFGDFSPGNVKELEIPCKKLDTLFLELRLSVIDYLKIDTEGAEYKILCGAEELLKNQKISFIQFEYGLVDEKIPSVEMIYNLLNQYGYKEVLVSGREQLWVKESIYEKIKNS